MTEVGVVFYWESEEENRYSGNKWNLLLLHDTIKPLGANLLILINPKQLPVPSFLDDEMKFEIYSSLEEALARHKEKEFVFLESPRNIPKDLEAVPLTQFKHPRGDTLYIIGPDSSNLPLSKLAKKNLIKHLVTIRTVKNYSCWSFVVAGIALFDRRAKLGCSNNS